MLTTQLLKSTYFILMNQKRKDKVVSIQASINLKSLMNYSIIKREKYLVLSSISMLDFIRRRKRKRTIFLLSFYIFLSASIQFFLRASMQGYRMFKSSCAFWKNGNLLKIQIIWLKNYKSISDRHFIATCFYVFLAIKWAI